MHYICANITCDELIIQKAYHQEINKILLTYLRTYLLTFQMTIYKYISIYKYIIYSIGFTIMTKTWPVDILRVRIHYIVM
jgi:hypothetical protein